MITLIIAITLVVLFAFHGAPMGILFSSMGMKDRNFHNDRAREAAVIGIVGEGGSKKGRL